MFEGQETAFARPVTQGEVVSRDTTLANFIVGLRSSGIRRSGIIAAFEEISRADFLPPSLKAHAFAPFPLPIACGENAAPPDFVARLVAGLDPSGSERVLEIGTGTGYQTAILSRIVRSVVSVDRWAHLSRLARETFDRRKLRNIEVRHADGMALNTTEAFDAIVINGIMPANATLFSQLKPGGRMISAQQRGPHAVLVCERREGDALVAVSEIAAPDGLFADLRTGVAKLL
jgi:protein-L-isoaspartate(D-aspartate) O-methyltransferase